MQLEHRIGQLLLIGLPGAQIDGSGREVLQTIQPGGVILDSRNIESAQQVAEMTVSVRALVKVPPLVAINQEGGRMDPLKQIYAPMPSADLLRASGDAAIAARVGEITAEALRTLGFNVNFAPVLDLALNDSADNGLKGRYMGSSPAQVVRLAGAYLEGLQRGGVIGAAKHFPGMGGAAVDPSRELPTIDRSRDEVTKQDLLPYLELFSKINARLNSVVVSHGHYPAFDGHAALPASLSKNIVNGLLRDELGFKGLTITDDIGMGAISSKREPSEAAIMAIEAGNDMVTVTESPERATAIWQAMVQAARDGRINKTYISRSFDHIARVKSMISPPLTLTDMAVMRLRERIGELNLVLQHAK